MRLTDPRGAFAVLLLAAGIGCGGDDAPPPAAISAVTGNSQLGAVGSAVEPLGVLVSSSNQQPVGNVTVTWAVAAGGATVDPVSSVTDAQGRAQTTLTFGSTPGAVSVVATVTGTSLTTRFAETSSAAVNSACSALTALVPGAGAVARSVQGSSICLGGGTAGADYAIIQFNASTNAGATGSATVTVSGQDVVPVSSADAIPAGLVPVQLAGGLQAAVLSRYAAAQAGLEGRIHAAEARVLPRYVDAARAWMDQDSGALRDAIPKTVRVGDLLRLNGNSIDACDNASIRVGRVAAISKNAIVVADTANPPGGFGDADYQYYAVTFDTLINPLDTATFGAPADIDHNGRELIFFTRAVNELTTPNSGSVIGGFFIARDLFPQTGKSGCAGSNVGEMFYMQVPDPNGVVNGNRSSVADVQQVTLATLAHEYQHLINASRRLYVTRSPDYLEDQLLNEGLSHIAEELLFYKESGLTPLQNLDANTLRQSDKTLEAFNSAQLANETRYMLYLESPSTSSPYADDDDLEDRGAVWGFLRWAADHKGGNQTTTWHALVNSQKIGLDNLRGVFGPDIAEQFRDYATSLFADDVPGVTEPRALQPSWNQRNITPALTGPGEAPYPLAVVPLANGSHRTIPLRAGGAAYLRFTVQPGAFASIAWSSSAGSTINVAMVRSR